MLILIGGKPSPRYIAAIVLSIVISIAGFSFCFYIGELTVLKGSLSILGVGSLIYYYLLPIIAKRQDYIGEEPKMQLVKISIVPYLVFMFICLLVAGYGWYASV